MNDFNMMPKCNAGSNTVKAVIIINPLDIKSLDNGKLVMKRKYGKFKREIKRYNV